MSEHGENELKILLLLHDDEIRNSEEKANQLNLNLNIKQIIIDCNYDKSCVLKKIKQFIEEKEQIIAEENLLRAMINEEQKNKLKRDKNY
ncbi:MAG: hypothetical protein RBR65_00240 [Aliarcobacter sp.]|jgi:hypothetical protein|nr:hypothetical protein [Aliarcobacter sp.]